ncbi:hypothetical protein NDU88_003072 [Pleurodeles waltl]|uniref:Uncharacterized protein n=1 Tax=Pleurodeles waltl TaxID=8319 RepID=A0AAV7QAR0_PLEWA|nr:hypothetical protein NDU88_003072 [Pleurodeles waltl]
MTVPNVGYGIQALELVYECGSAGVERMKKKGRRHTDGAERRKEEKHFAAKPLGVVSIGVSTPHRVLRKRRERLLAARDTGQVFTPDHHKWSQTPIYVPGGTWLNKEQARGLNRWRLGWGEGTVQVRKGL